MLAFEEQEKTANTHLNVAIVKIGVGPRAVWFLLEKTLSTCTLPDYFPLQLWNLLPFSFSMWKYGRASVLTSLHLSRERAENKTSCLQSKPDKQFLLRLTDGSIQDGRRRGCGGLVMSAMSPGCAAWSGQSPLVLPALVLFSPTNLHFSKAQINTYTYYYSFIFRARFMVYS